MISTMAKKQQEPVDRHKKPGLTVRFTPKVHEAIEELAKQERRKKTDMIRLLVEDALLQRGIMPSTDLSE